MNLLVLFHHTFILYCVLVTRMDPETCKSVVQGVGILLRVTVIQQTSGCSGISVTLERRHHEQLQHIS